MYPIRGPRSEPLCAVRTSNFLLFHGKEFEITILTAYVCQAKSTISRWILRLRKILNSQPSFEIWKDPPPPPPPPKPMAVYGYDLRLITYRDLDFWIERTFNGTSTPYTAWNSRDILSPVLKCRFNLKCTGNPWPHTTHHWKPRQTPHAPLFGLFCGQ